MTEEGKKLLEENLKRSKRSSLFSAIGDYLEDIRDREKHSGDRDEYLKREIQYGVYLAEAILRETQEISRIQKEDLPVIVQMDDGRIRFFYPRQMEVFEATVMTEKEFKECINHHTGMIIYE